MAELDNGGMISLADMAGLDTTEIAEVRFSTLPIGVYDFKCTNAELIEGTNADEEQRFIAVFDLEVVEVKQIMGAPGTDKDSLVGKKQTEKLYIVPEKFQEGVGLIRSFMKDLGLPNEGPLGPLVESAVDHIFPGKIVHKPDKNDKTRKYARLVLDPKK